MRGPAQACNSSNDTPEALKAEELKAEADEEEGDGDKEAEDGVSSSSVVLRSIKPTILRRNKRSLEEKEEEKQEFHECIFQKQV